MRDEDEGELAALLQPLQQQQDLRLDRDVEGGNRLVGDEQFGLKRQRASDADALALPAAEFVRIAHHRIVGQADLGEEGARPRLAFGIVGDAVDAHRLDQCLADPAARIERGIGVLEDDLQLAAQRAHPCLAGGDDVLALEDYLAGIGLDEAEDGASSGRLAAAGLADKAEGLAVAHGEGDAVEGTHGDDARPRKAARHGEEFAQAGDGQDGISHGRPRSRLHVEGHAASSAPDDPARREARRAADRAACRPPRAGGSAARSGSPTAWR